jgi:hypothetical protein
MKIYKKFLKMQKRERDLAEVQMRTKQLKKEQTKQKQKVR